MTTQTLSQSTTKEAFYLERFKRAIAKFYTPNGRMTNEDTKCELYKGFAIITWERDFSNLSKGSDKKFQTYVWEIGGFYDHLQDLSWCWQGVVTWTSGDTTYESANKKVKKKIDLLSLMYPRKQELQALALARVPRPTEPLYNAQVGDVVGIGAFGRYRAGIVVTTTGSRFIVAYMTPSNSNDVHYKILPLSRLFPKE